MLQRHSPAEKYEPLGAYLASKNNQHVVRLTFEDSSLSKTRHTAANGLRKPKSIPPTRLPAGASRPFATQRRMIAAAYFVRGSS